MKALLVTLLERILNWLDGEQIDDFAEEDDQPTLMVISGEGIGLMELGLALPLLAKMFPQHTICFDQNKTFSKRNGMGADVLFVYDGFTKESVVLQMEDLLANIGDRVLH